MKVRNVLVGCETSGRTREALRGLGINAWSCDLLPSDDNSPYHLQMDVRAATRMPMPWHGFIVHPTCTYLSSSGLHWNKRRPERALLTEEAIAFAISMMEEPIEHIVMENPIGCLSTRYRKPDQIVHPYHFGDDASKATCLWMKNCPKLVIDPADYFPPRLVCDHCGHNFKYGMHKCPKCRCERFKPRWSNQTDSGQNKLPPTDDRWKLRSETYPGIANALAKIMVSL